MCHRHRFNSHSPGDPGLTGCPVASDSLPVPEGNLWIQLAEIFLLARCPSSRLIDNVGAVKEAKKTKKIAVRDVL